MKLLHAVTALSLILINPVSAAETIVEDFTSTAALDAARTTAAWNTNSGVATLGKTRPRFGQIYSSAGFDESFSADSFDFPNDYVFADLNNDSLGDLFYITDSVNYYYMSVPGTDLAAQPPSALLENFDSTSTVLAGDFDNDGDKDIYVAIDDTSPNTRSYVYINDGNAVTPFSVANKWFVGQDGDRFVDAALADLNSDGFPDLVLAEVGGPVYLLNDQKEDPFDQAVRGDIGSGTQTLQQVLPADFNGDGLVDVLVMRSSGDSLLYLNDGSSQPFSAASAGLPLGNSISLDRAISTDLNNDAFMDLVASRFGYDSYVFINGGPGVLFSQPEIYIEPDVFSGSQYRSAADFNSDGLQDFAFTGSQSAYLYLNDGAGVSFGAVTIDGMSSSTRHTAIDYNGDAVADLIYNTSVSPDGLRVHLNTLSENPYSVTTSPRQFGLPAGLTRDLTVFDVDNDGDNDVAVAQNGHNLLFLNNGVPLLAESVNVTGDQDDTRAIAAADLNGDEFDDIVAANNGLNRWYPNDLGDGPFLRAVTGVVIGSASVATLAVATGDLNGDELIDIVFGNAGQNHVYYGANADSPFDSTSVATPLGATSINTRGVVVADFDDDGDLDIATANDGVNYWYANDGSVEPFNAATEAQPLGTDTAASNDIAVADVDFDGLPDVVVANTGFNRWYRNTGAPGIFDADVDGVQLGFEEADSRAISAHEIAGGAVEIAVANAGESPAHLYRLLQPGDQVDVTEIDLQEVSSAGSSISTGDINGDSAPDIVLGNLLASDEVIFGTNQTASLAANAGFNLFADTVQSVALPGVTEEVQTVALLPEDTIPTNTTIEYFVGAGPDRMQRIFPGLVATLPAPSTELFWRARLSSLSPAVSPVIDRLTFLVNPLDTDADQIADISDNCTVVGNTGQLDTDSDGFGNACDTDLNNDGITNFADLDILKQVFFSGAEAADFTGDGIVNFEDLEVMKNAFFGPPGPAGEL